MIKKLFNNLARIDVATSNCDYSINDTQGIISSPKFPHNYPSNQNCSWNIFTKTGHRIMVV